MLYGVRKPDMYIQTPLTSSVKINHKTAAGIQPVAVFNFFIGFLFVYYFKIAVHYNVIRS